MRELVVSAEKKELEHVQAFIAEQLEALGCPKKIRFQIEIAVEEIFVNIVSYAYQPETGKAKVQCEVNEETLQISITFFDKGKPFDPLTQKEVDTSQEALLKREGGLGIFMVKKSMDDVNYRYENGQNILTICKSLKSLE